MPEPQIKIAFIDLENAPNTGFTWDRYEQNVIAFVKEWYIMSFAIRWAGSNKTDVYALPDFEGYEKDKTDDKALVKKLWEVVNEADIIIAHNADRFDVRKANARFLYHGLTPPAPYKTIDTLKVARKVFKLNSNKLDDLGSYLGVGRKINTGGFELWLKCMAGDAEAWRKMKQYNRQDVNLLEKVYEKLRPWHATHPNITIQDTSSVPKCPACGSSKVQHRGWNYIQAYKTQRFQCKNCGKWSKGSSEKLEGVHLK